MRRGEVLGLEWSDIDFNEGFLHIIASQYVASKGIFVKDPKTHSSIRKVGIPDIVINMLKKYKTWYATEKERCGDLWVNSNRLFVTWNGKQCFLIQLQISFVLLLKRITYQKLLSMVCNTQMSLCLYQKM